MGLCGVAHLSRWASCVSVSSVVRQVSHFERGRRSVPGCWLFHPGYSFPCGSYSRPQFSECAFRHWNRVGHCAHFHVALVRDIAEVVPEGRAFVIHRPLSRVVVDRRQILRRLRHLSCFVNQLVSFHALILPKRSGYATEIGIYFTPVSLGFSAFADGSPTIG